MLPFCLVDFQFYEEIADEAEKGLIETERE